MRNLTIFSSFNAQLRALLFLSIGALLTACGGGGGGDSAVGIIDNSNPFNEPVTPINPNPADSAPFTSADEVQAQITSVTMDGTPVVNFTVADQQGRAIVDLTESNVSFTLAKLVEGQNGDSDYWQSYFNTTEQPNPDLGPGTEAKTQATRTSAGTLLHKGNGAYSFTFSTDITAITSPIAVTYEPNLTHRVAIQFGGGPIANPVFTWVPATGATENITSRDIVATATCNNCHDPLALHGGGRRETQYCVTCHNPGSSDAISGNTVDMKVMIHKIHRGASLPSIVNGGEFVIFGFRDSAHDYSGIHFPQEIRNCTTCHAGSATGQEGQILTNQGDNWSTKPTQQACGSCHDDVDFATHQGGQTNNSQCVSCHTPEGANESVITAHQQPIQLARKDFQFNIHSITNTAPGQFPTVTYSVTNPNTGTAYNLLSDAPWTSTSNGASRLAIDLAWNTDDYSNTGNGASNASAVSIDALANATAVGNGQYQATSTVAIPDGSAAPFKAATGSGAAVLEGHPAVDVGTATAPDVQQIPVTNAISFFSIDETNGTAQPRRDIVDLDKCLNCHNSLSLHGNNRTDNINTCVTCHNPRNTDKSVRDVATTPPADGKPEESLDFKTMIHGIHAASFREQPLAIVGFRGLSTHTYDETAVHFPGSLENCATCHEGDSYQVPLANTVLGTTRLTGTESTDPDDDTVITPTAAVCASCHDSSLAQTHMEQNGGNFSTTQAAITGGVVVETCSVCHGAGRTADVSVMHNVH